MIRYILVYFLTAIVIFSFVTLAAEANAQDSIWYGTNGYKIYLSPAEHNGNNIGCDGYVEDDNARYLALQVAIGHGSNLISRGYTVRVGTGDLVQNTNSSNSWNAHYHISLHSNAIDPYNCAIDHLDYGASGTIAYYSWDDANSIDLSSKILTKLWYHSPGRGTDDTRSETFYELQETNAPAAYVESGFHTFRPDEDWLRTYANWGWRIASAIDWHLGHPR